MSDPTLTAAAASLVALAKAINDIDELVKHLLSALGRTKPWQRELATHLTDVGGMVQILRLTIVMERGDAEILEAAQALSAACRRAHSSAVGSRVDHMTMTALALMSDLARRVCVGLDAVA